MLTIQLGKRANTTASFLIKNLLKDPSLQWEFLGTSAYISDVYVTHPSQFYEHTSHLHDIVVGDESGQGSLERSRHLVVLKSLSDGNR